VRGHWVLLVLALAAFAVPAVADDGLKCWSFGATCGSNGTITASLDGDVTGNIYYTKADFSDWVRVIDINPNNSWTSDWMLNNSLGTGQPTVTFGHALKGDLLVVQLCDQQEQPNICTSNSKLSYLFGSDPKYSADGLSHAMVPDNGGASATAKGDGPRTQLIWLEDLADKQNTDWDYNDLVLALHNVNVTFLNDGGTSQGSPVPEPATLSLLASGVMAGVIRRIKKS
jgi:hypothetical protein